MEGISVHAGSLLQIAEFILFMWEELKLSVLAVKGYWASINHVFSIAGMDFATSRIISRMFSSCQKICPLREVTPPDWILSLVLRSLTCLPYELLKLSSDNHLSWWNCSLLALTSAKRARPSCVAIYSSATLSARSDAFYLEWD